MLLDKALQKRGYNRCCVDSVVIETVHGRILPRCFGLYEIGLDGVDAPIQQTNSTRDREHDARENVIATQAILAELLSVYLRAFADATPEDVGHVHYR